VAQTIREAKLEVSVSVADACTGAVAPTLLLPAPVAKIERRVKYAEFTRDGL
jgi:hypothetical protein